MNQDQALARYPARKRYYYADLRSSEKRSKTINWVSIVITILFSIPVIFFFHRFFINKVTQYGFMWAIGLVFFIIAYFFILFLVRSDSDAIKDSEFGKRKRALSLAICEDGLIVANQKYLTDRLHYVYLEFKNLELTFFGPQVGNHPADRGLIRFKDDLSRNEYDLKLWFHLGEYDFYDLINELKIIPYFKRGLPPKLEDNFVLKKVLTVLGVFFVVGTFYYYRDIKPDVERGAFLHINQDDYVYVVGVILFLFSIMTVGLIGLSRLSRGARLYNHWEREKHFLKREQDKEAHLSSDEFPS